MLYYLINRRHEIYHLKKKKGLLICCFGFVENCRFYVGYLLQLLLSVNRVFRLQKHTYSSIPNRHWQCFFTLWTPHLTFLNENVYTAFQLDATEVCIADLIACSTCFGHHYAPSSGAQEYYTVVAACGISCYKNVKSNL